jgi:RNA polymerase sigma-70 factor (ECF subfamily)
MNEDNRPTSGDAELVHRAQSGDAEAFGKLYERYADPIYRYIYSRVTVEAEAEDLTEAVFLKAFTAIGQYREKGHPYSAYLYRVAKNTLTDHWRERKTTLPLEDAEEVKAQDPVLDDQMIQFEQRTQLSEAITQLPEDYQEVIRLRVLLGMSTRQTAWWLQRSEGAVRVLLHRALKALRMDLEENQRQ